MTKPPPVLCKSGQYTNPFNKWDLGETVHYSGQWLVPYPSVDRHSFLHVVTPGEKLMKQGHRRKRSEKVSRSNTFLASSPYSLPWFQEGPRGGDSEAKRGGSSPLLADGDPQRGWSWADGIASSPPLSVWLLSLLE